MVKGIAKSGRGCAMVGVRTSPRRVLRLMRERALLAHQRAGSPRGPRAHDGTITTSRVDEMWDAPCRDIGPSDNGE